MFQDLKHILLLPTIIQVLIKHRMSTVVDISAVRVYYSTVLLNLNCQSFEAVSRYRDPQLQVTENLCDLRNLSPNIDQCFKT